MPLFQLSGIRKAFGAVRALNWSSNTTLNIEIGQVWAFAGENGAGKSTLGAILAGVTARDAGSLRLDGRDYAPASVAEARAAGVQIVLQEPALIPSLTVAENLFVGREAEFRHIGLQWRGRMVRAAAALLADIGPHIDPAAAARDLSLEDQKLVETARAVSANPRCIIFDETTATMSSHNTSILLKLIARLRPTTAVVIVTHRTNEIFDTTDKILILKDGQFVAARDTASTTPEELSSLMVGREVDLNLRQKGALSHKDAPLLDIVDMTVEGGITDFALTLNRGDIVGIGGLAGAGQERILRAIYGLDRLASGRVRVRGDLYKEASPRRSIGRGILYSPKNRDREGLILRNRVRENVVLSILDRLSVFGLRLPPRETRTASKLARQLNVKCSSVEDMCLHLSGGNRQKVVLAKLLATEGDIFLLDNPTRGIDIGARAEIYQLMNRLTLAGAGIVLLSDELQELLQMSDSILLVREGRVSKAFRRDDKPQEADLIRHMI